jgi:hypothetical protein
VIFSTRWYWFKATKLVSHLYLEVQMAKSIVYEQRMKELSNSEDSTLPPFRLFPNPTADVATFEKNNATPPVGNIKFLIC